MAAFEALRQPCTAENLAEVMVELCERRDLTGVFHWAGAELISRHALGWRIREHFRLPEGRAPIVAVTRGATPEAARKRQACLALDLAPLAGKLKTRPQTIAEQLGELKVPPPCREWFLKRSYTNIPSLLDFTREGGAARLGHGEKTSGVGRGGGRGD